jgi:O-antigen/teichoic acid export membrane protein
VNQAWVPWLYERLARDDDHARAEIRRTIQAGSILLIAGAVVMALLATPLVLLVGGSPYLPATQPLRILAFYAAFQAWYTLMSAFIFYAERTRLMSTLTVVVALLQAALIALLVRWGATGVAMALLGSSLFAAIAISLVVLRLAASYRSTVPEQAAGETNSDAHSLSRSPPACGG